jgi:hypothetical protein
MPVQYLNTALNPRDLVFQEKEYHLSTPLAEYDLVRLNSILCITKPA